MNISKQEIIDLISCAFDSVELEDGISLQQAAIIDNYGEGYTDKEFDDISLSEVTTNWHLVPKEDLEAGNIPHLDAAGFRYYIPIFMISVLNDYDNTSMRVISTISGLYPKIENQSFHLEHYSLFNEAQGNAIAVFLTSIQKLIALDHEDQTIVQRALRNYWGKFL